MALLVTRTELARTLGKDVRSLRDLPKPVHFLISGLKRIPLFPFPSDQLAAAIVVNAAQHPLKASIPEV
jgi:hypothetical protein